MRPRPRRAPRPAAALLAAGLAACATPEAPDPIEPVNRPLFAVNEGVDRWLLEPVAVGWDFVLPDVVETGIWNFYRNLEMPMVFLNDLLQAKPVPAGWDLSRFAVNTTAGVAGFVDVASRLGIPQNDEDFGQTLGRWGVPPGAYLVAPLLGPFTLRDFLAYPVDVAAQPHRWLVPAASVPDLINTRARFLEEIRENRRTAFDYYLFVRNAYLQNRRQRVDDALGTEREARHEAYEMPADEDLYYPEEPEAGGEPGTGAPAPDAGGGREPGEEGDGAEDGEGSP